MKKQLLYALVTASIAAPAYGFTLTFVNKTNKTLGVALTMYGFSGTSHKVDYPAQVGSVLPNGTVSKSFGGDDFNAIAKKVQIGNMATGVIVDAPIYLVSQAHYDALMPIAQNGSEVAAYMARNNMNPTEPTDSGDQWIFVDRTFAIIERANGSFIIITAVRVPQPESSGDMTSAGGGYNPEYSETWSRKRASSGRSYGGDAGG